MTAILPAEVLEKSATVLEQLKTAGLMVVTAESCTGGLVAGALTAHAGSSAAVAGGFVTYSNAMKQAALGVPADMLAQWGAVSAQVAQAMAEGALAHAPDAGIAVSLTGVAGPDGGSEEKPVGLVWFGLQRAGKPPITQKKIFGGDRTEVRAQSVLHALKMIQDSI
ncbi:nicotinamide-nucleotide amidohydrolase family protein [Acetobacter sicerae]|uniref:Nicotinamide-nucleotide amidohydrolase family protein n=1 Tax=Acetobacter sicerae TaxID=85325 RepID=A0ABS8VYD9_9PROT|nr:nicotinamide-nucleotide amidohydrolase family protein [Acetobacter sicerae]MCE0744759.1 nicotinamide-nucleotide amidohydrolase family protein [Acetobacter sicerae]